MKRAEPTQPAGSDAPDATPEQLDHLEPVDNTPDEPVQVELAVEPTDTEPTDTEPTDTEPTDTEPTPARDDLEVLQEQATATSQRLRRAELHVKARHVRYEEAGRRLEEARASRDSIIQARESLSSWLDERSRSMSIRLMRHVDGELARIERDEQTMRNFGEVRDFAGQARRLRRMFVRKLLTASVFALAIPLILLVIALILRIFNIPMPYLELSPWRYVAVFLIIFVLGSFGSLFSYYRGYLSMRHHLDQSLRWGRHAMGAIDRIRSDYVRLNELRPQLAERLEFYGGMLQSPWLVPGDDGEMGSLRPIGAGLPANLRIAEVSDAGEDTWNKLLQRFTAEQFSIGLRREAAKRLLAEAARRAGMDPTGIDFEFLDRDNLQKGLRTVLMGYASSTEVLHRLGRERVAHNARKIQTELSPLDDHRPDVVVSNPDELDGLRLGQDTMAGWLGSQDKWDDFLAEILEHPSALSILAFSEIGEAYGAHQQFRSLASGPERVRGRSSEHVDWIHIQSNAITSTEVVTRIDITDPIDVSHVALFRAVLDDDRHVTRESDGGVN